MPKGWVRYFEPFLGGGAVFFRLMDNTREGAYPFEVYLGDANKSLVEMYQAVQRDVEPVIETLKVLEAEHSKTTYYAARDVYNNEKDVSPAERAALFIYLNKTGFNGLYRVNRKGMLNNPVGSLSNGAKKKIVCDEEGLRAASLVLQKVMLCWLPFEDTIASAKPGDFVYLDPPYQPTSETSNFTRYTQDGFDEKAQAYLAEICGCLDGEGVKFMLSNSDTPLINDLYQKFNITRVLAPRSVSGKGSSRGKISELVVRNYG